MLRISASVLFTCLALCAGCASAPASKEQKTYTSRDNWIPVYSAGITKIYSTSDVLFIESIDPDSPAQTAGIQIGDLIAAVNGKKLSEKEFYQLNRANRGENIAITINRGGQNMEFDLKPVKRMKWPPSADKLSELLQDGQKISLAVFVADVKSDGKDDSKAWEEAQRKQWHEFINNHILKEFGKYKNFTVVNSALMYNTLDRHKFNMAGDISEDARNVISKMTGATHLLIATLSRIVDDNNTQVEIASARLIDIQTGKDLALDQRIDCK
jgi:membrane-associated protease RseP (regulator of RpoE activity)